MKVAITGGTGLLGLALTKELDKLEIDYIILSRTKSNDEKIFLTNYSKENLSYILSDCNAVVHLAASRGPNPQIKDFHTDEIITQNIYDVCVDIGIKNIIYASSISVYSDEAKLPWSEDQLPTPISMYGISKLACEMIGNFYAEMYGLSIKNFRFAHLFGDNEKNNYMINLFMRKALNNKKLTLDTQSTAKREFLYVQDAAMAIIKGLRLPLLKGTFNIGSQNILTNNEVAKHINDIFQNRNNLKVLSPEKKDSSKSSYMSHVKARNILDFEDVFNFPDALEQIYLNMKGRKNVPIRY